MNLKIMLVLIVGLSYMFLNWSCQQSHVVVYFENKSTSTVDSIIIYLNSYRSKFSDIKQGDIVNIEVPIDSLNIKKEAVIISRIYMNDSAFNGQIFYSDLGVIFTKGKLTLTDSLSTKWNIIEK